MTLLVAEDIVKSYPGVSSPTLAGVTVSVDAGEVLWVSGRSGSGKTTLLNVLGLLTGVDSGHYLVQGTDMAQASAEDRRRARQNLISTVFQRGNLFGHLSALDNVLLGLFDDDRGRARDMLEGVGMAHAADRKAGLLSGGEQMRVAFARAASRRTPVLLADEPIAGLDAGSARTILDILGTAADEGAAVVLVSHDDRAATIADSRLTLDALT